MLAIYIHHLSIVKNYIQRYFPWSCFNYLISLSVTATLVDLHHYLMYSPLFPSAIYDNSNQVLRKECSFPLKTPHYIQVDMHTGQHMLTRWFRSYKWSAFSIIYTFYPTVPFSTWISESDCWKISLALHLWTFTLFDMSKISVFNYFLSSPITCTTCAFDSVAFSWGNTSDLQLMDTFQFSTWYQHIWPY